MAMRYDSDETEKQYAILRLIEILSVRNTELFPLLIPQLINKLVSINRAKALGTISLATKNIISFTHYSISYPLIE
jgi:hypothetical protein